MHRGPLQNDIAYNSAVTNVENKLDYRRKKTPPISLYTGHHMFPIR